MTNFTRPRGWLVLGLAAVCAASAEERSSSTQEGAQAAGPIESVTVYAHPLSASGVAQASLVLAGESLQRSIAANLGSTLAKQAGIHSAAFGDAVGRPVIHGLSGPRVRIMQDRLDTLDVSVTSGDHAVSVEPFIAERIEVLKGANSLLYGAGAIGGVVNVHTGRIPQQLASKAISGGVEARHNNNGRGSTTALKLNGGGGKIAWHLDDTRKEADNYRIPNAANSFSQQQLSGTTGVVGSLPGSHFKNDASAAGVSYFNDHGFVGVALSTIDAEYGLPGDHGGEIDTPTLALEQQRVDVEWQQDQPWGGFDSFNLRFAINDYEHQEIEPDGEVASVFDNKAWELRAQVRRDGPTWASVGGLQYTDKRFSAKGEEAFIAPVDSTDAGVFWLAQRDLLGFDIELGGRLGRVEHQPLAGGARHYSNYSAAMGVLRSISDSVQLGLQLDRSSRAPVAEELFSNGPHLVTNSFELGNSNLGNESATNVSANLHYQTARQLFSVTAYVVEFDDYIFQADGARIEDGLPVVVYQQADARFHGVDIQAGLGLFESDTVSLQLTAMYDRVYARLREGVIRALPRTPPQRWGLGLDGHWGGASAALEYTHVSAQNEVAAGELPSPSYTDLSLHADYRIPLAAGAALTLFVQAKNIGDQDQRTHTSFIKEVAPAPGRSVSTGLRLEF